VRQATVEDLSTVSAILTEAAEWLEQKNMPLWEQEHIALSIIDRDIELGLFYIAFYEGIAAGVAVRKQIEKSLSEDLHSIFRLLFDRININFSYNTLLNFTHFTCLI
jgi:hypothetical protein